MDGLERLMNDAQWMTNWTDPDAKRSVLQAMMTTAKSRRADQSDGTCYHDDLRQDGAINKEDRPDGRRDDE